MVCEYYSITLIVLKRDGCLPSHGLYHWIKASCVFSQKHYIRIMEGTLYLRPS